MPDSNGPLVEQNKLVLNLLSSSNKDALIVGLTNWAILYHSDVTSQSEREQAPQYATHAASQF